MNKNLDYPRFALRLNQQGYNLMSRWEQYIPPKLSPLQVESKICLMSWFCPQKDDTVLLEVTIVENVLCEVINVYHQKPQEVTDEQIVDWLDKNYHDYLLVPPDTKQGQFLWGLYSGATLVASGRSVRDCMISYLRLEI